MSQTDQVLKRMVCFPIRRVGSVICYLRISLEASPSSTGSWVEHGLLSVSEDVDGCGWAEVVEPDDQPLFSAVSCLVFREEAASFRKSPFRRESNVHMSFRDCLSKSNGAFFGNRMNTRKYCNRVQRRSTTEIDNPPGKSPTYQRSTA